MHRSSGVLLHISSLPGGRLGREAYRFVDWLVEAGQSWWALLPLAPPDSTGSPYASPSAFAAHAGFLERPHARVTPDELEAFVARERYWIADWAAFAGTGAIAGQVRFEREWSALRRYAAGRGVRIFGDVPIYVAKGGADVEAHPDLFQTGVVAGAPPDGLSAFGQHWGNPLYDWSAMRAQGYRWWIERFRRTFELYDVARIDHFRGFVAYWAVPEHHKTAKHGRFRPGPGAELFRAAEGELGPLALVAEDLGVITPPVERLRDRLGIPGMVVMQFAFEGPPVEPAPDREPPPAERRLRRHTRLRHRARLVAHAARPRPPGDRPSGDRAELGADRARTVLPRRAGDRSRRRTSWGWAARRG